MMADLRRQILVLILFTELVLLAGSTGQAVAQERTPIRTVEENRSGGETRYMEVMKSPVRDAAEKIVACRWFSGT